MQIVLIGASGYIGSELAREIDSRGHFWTKLGRSECDLYDPIALTKVLLDLAPDFVVNSAGYTGKPNVDACEYDKTNCLAGNALLPGIISEACKNCEIPWGHVSSGCIYTGRRVDGHGFSEIDPPNFSFRQNNCSFYSGTKALGEEIIGADRQCYVWRLRIPFSHVDSPRNYLTKVMRYDWLLEAENSLSHLPEFAVACLDCIENQLPFGIYNLTNPGSVKTSDVVQMIQRAGLVEKTFRFFESEAQFMERVAITPRSNCILDSSKAIQAGLTLTPIEEILSRSLAEWQSN